MQINPELINVKDKKVKILAYFCISEVDSKAVIVSRNSCATRLREGKSRGMQLASTAKQLPLK